MEICRFDNNRLGVVEGEFVRDVTAALDLLPAHRYPLPTIDLLIAYLPQLMAEIRRLLPNAPAITIDSVRLLNPPAHPGIVVAAVNYKQHFGEARAQSEIHHPFRLQKCGTPDCFLRLPVLLSGRQRTAHCSTRSTQ